MEIISELILVHNRMKQYYVYILASKPNGTLYIGITGNIIQRLRQHKNDKTRFVAKYKIHNLVYYETHGDPQEAIRREKQLKKWRRQWKIDLIQKSNPDWRDLSQYTILP